MYHIKGTLTVKKQWSMTVEAFEGEGGASRVLDRVVRVSELFKS